MRVYECPGCKKRVKTITTQKNHDILICTNICCIFWEKGYWEYLTGEWHNYSEKHKLINVPNVFDTKIEEKPESKWKRMWNDFFCTVGIHDYRSEEVRLVPYGVVGISKTCRYCGHRIWEQNGNE